MAISPGRATQGGRHFLHTSPGGLRATQGGRQLLWKQEEPNRPRILSVTNIGTSTATVTSSTYSSPEGEAHANTRYQVQLAGGDWSAIIYDTGVLGPVTTAQLSGMLPLLAYQVRVAYADAEGDWSLWSSAYFFQTTDVPSTPGTFDPADWAVGWNIARARYHPGIYASPGGWWGPISWSRWNATGVGQIDAGFTGHVAAMGRLFGPPTVLVNTDIGANNGVNVAGKVSWHSSQSGYSWERWYDCEGAAAGLAALICGTCEPVDPELAWNVWRLPGPNDWPCETAMQGVVAYIRPRAQWPYEACACCPPDDDSLAGWVISQIGSLAWCFFYGIDLDPALVVEVWYGGARARKYTFPLPWKVVYNSLWERYDCVTGAWTCRHFPKYGVRLKVWHDYDADSTGKTHRIQAAATSPPTAYHPGSGAGDHNLAQEGDWGFGTASLPAEDGPWMIDETWVGGHEESSPGAGDGGLYAGWTGWCAQRATGVVPTRVTGGNIYLDLVTTPLDLTHCETPCDLSTVPENGITPEGEEAPPIQALAPCPPDVDTADKELYLGGMNEDGSIYKFGGYEVMEGGAVVARIRPNPIAPMGYSGQALFRRMVVVCEHFSDIQIAVVPILNGERLDKYAQEEVFIGPGDRAAMRRFEVPLYRAFEDAVVEGADDDRFKYGLRGTYFTFEMTIVDLCGVGLQLPGVWVEYEGLREAQGTGVVYTEDLLRAPVFLPSGQVFMGTKGYNRLLKAGSGVTDDGLEVQARMFSNPVAPETEAGECEFRRLSLVVTRWNDNPMTMTVTPYVDGDPMAPVEVEYQAATAPVTEITEIDLASYYRRQGADAVERFRHRRRGAWFHMKVETGSGLQEWLSVEGGEVEYDVVREALTKDVR